MLETLLLVVALAGNPSDPIQSVLVLRSGQAMRVLSYEISDTMVLVRSLNNEPLSIRKERIDLERSAELTRQLRERQTRHQEQTAVSSASPVPKTGKPARRHEPSERWRAGSLSTMSSDHTVERRLPLVG